MIVIHIFYLNFQKPPPGAVKVMPTAPEKKKEEKLSEKKIPAENGMYIMHDSYEDKDLL